MAIADVQPPSPGTMSATSKHGGRHSPTSEREVWFGGARLDCHDSPRMKAVKVGRDVSENHEPAPRLGWPAPGITFSV